MRPIYYRHKTSTTRAIHWFMLFYQLKQRKKQEHKNLCFKKPKLCSAQRRDSIDFDPNVAKHNHFYVEIIYQLKRISRCLTSRNFKIKRFVKILEPKYKSAANANLSKWKKKSEISLKKMNAFLSKFFFSIFFSIGFYFLPNQMNPSRFQRVSFLFAFVSCYLKWRTWYEMENDW